MQRKACSGSTCTLAVSPDRVPRVMCSLLKVTVQRGVEGRLHQVGFGVTGDRNSDQADFRGETEAVGWERNRSRNGITPGLGSSLPSLSDSVLAALSCSFSPLGGKTAASCSQQHQEKKKTDSFC